MTGCTHSIVGETRPSGRGVLDTVSIKSARGSLPERGVYAASPCEMDEHWETPLPASFRALKRRKRGAPNIGGSVKKRKQRASHASALTLIELLVVIAILAVLAAVLLPSLTQAKGQARRLECLSRLKQWNVAFRLYAEDNEEWIARECYEPLGEVTINNWSQVKGRPQSDGTTDSRDVWYNALPPYVGQPPSLTYAALPDRKNFFTTHHLIHCPAARFPSYAFRPTYQFPLFSLAMNSQLIMSGPTVKFTMIEQRDPGRTVIFLDNLLEGETRVHSAQETTHLGQPGAYANRFGPRHQQGGNLAFADGHVAWFHGRDVVETHEDSPLLGGPILPPRDILWEVYPY